MSHSPDLETFGTWLRRRRRLLDLTQDQLGRLAGCSGAAIRKFEADERKPSRELAELLASALQISAPERDHFIRLARGIHPDTLPSTERIQPSTQPVENLPAPLTSLVDRTHDVSTVAAMLADPGIRWITLIGPPGIGKTRLSIQTGRQALPGFADGVWFVDLAPLEEAGFVLPALNRTLVPLGLSPSLNFEQLASVLKNRRLLVILDNFEHVTEAALEISALLRHIAGLKVLATSRIPLHIYGEHEYRVPPLSIPPRHPVKNPQELMGYESVQLLVVRVRQHQPSFTVTSQNASLLVNICATLEGIPLALELAAASLQRMTLVEMDAMLHDLDGAGWIKLFATSARDLPVRQRTLENVVAWSYTLLTAEQRALFCKLAVFSGWFTKDAVMEVCFEKPQSSPLALEALLAGLSDHSLLVRDRIHSAECWRMLEIIHEYASLQLDPVQRPALELRFIAYFLERMSSLSQEADEVMREVFFQLNAGNIHAALRYAIAHERAEMGFLLAEGMSPFWEDHGYLKEEVRLLKQLFALPDHSVPALRAGRLQQASDLAWQMHDFETGLAFAREAVELAQTHGLDKQYPWYLNRLGRIYIEQGRYAEARQALEECLALVRLDPTILNIGSPLAQLGELALFENRLEDAKSVFAQAFLHLSDAEDVFLAIATVDMAEIALAEGDFSAARGWLGRAFPYADLLIRRALVFLCAVAGYLVLSNPEDESALRKAARLYGAVESLMEHSGVVLGSFYRNLNNQRVHLARQKLSTGVWGQEFEVGLQWSRETALSEAGKMLTA